MNERFYDVAIGSLSAFLIFLTILAILFIPIVNPLPQSHTIPMGLNYPDIPKTSPFINQTEVGLQIFLKFTYTGELMENNKITVEYSSCQILLPNYSNVFQVRVGFSQALPWEFKNQVGDMESYTVTNWGTTFVNLHNETFLRGTPSNLYFPISGVYSPIITIEFKNESTPIGYTYENIRLPVLGKSDVDMLNISRVTVALTIALLVFSYIEAFTIIGKLWEKRKKAQSLITESSPPTNTTTKQIINDSRQISQNNATTAKYEKSK